MKKSITLLFALLLTLVGTTQMLADDYYLVGENIGWSAPNDYKFVVNPANSNEYVLSEVVLGEGEQIKVTSSTGQWFPEGTGNNYIITKELAGKVSIYFSPTYRNDWEDFGGYIWIEVIENQFVAQSVHLAGTFTDWANNNDQYALTEVSDGIWEYTYQNFPAEEHEFKFTVNKNWSVNFGCGWDQVCYGYGNDKTPFGTTIDGIYNEENIKINTGKVTDVVFRLDLTNYDPDDDTGAKITIYAHSGDLTLYGREYNDDIINENVGNFMNVKIVDHTLYKDGDWNTLILPFDVTIDGSILDGATVMELTDANITDKTLNLTFSEVNKVTHGKPCIIKWAQDENIESPEFKNVLIQGSENGLSQVFEGGLEFVGTFNYSNLTNDVNDILFLGSGNKLHYPEAYPYNLGAFHCFFYVPKGDASEGKAIESIVTNLDDNDPSAIQTVSSTQAVDNSWYTLSGQRLGGKPAKAGVYVVNGQKVMVK